MPVRALIEAFKIYKTVVCVLGRNLMLEPVIESLDKNETSDFDIYRYAIVGLEAISLTVMCLTMHYLAKTITLFNINEFDLIRNNFSANLYTKV